MKNLILIITTSLLFACSATEKHVEIIQPAFDFELVKKDSTYKLIYTIVKDSITEAQAQADLINVIRGSGANERTGLIIKYQKEFNSNFEMDVSAMIKKQLSGNWEVVGETFTRDLEIDDSTQFKFIEPNIIAMVYDNQVLSLSLGQNKIVGVFNDEKVVLKKKE